MDSATSGLSVQTAKPSGLPALDILLPLASQSLAFFATSLTFLSRGLQWLFAKIMYPVILLTPLFYILAPVVVLAQVALDFLVLTPYRIVLYFLALIYPLYVLVGVACIVGLVVGWIGRLVTVRLNMAVNPKKQKKSLRQR